MQNRSEYFLSVGSRRVEDNEEVDHLSKRSLKHPETDINVPLSKSEVNGIIKSALNRIWQEKWDNESKGRHHNNIQNKVEVDRNSYGSKKDEDSVISRLQIGHIHPLITHCSS